MKQEEKDLLLKDLCARLPYRVKVKSSRRRSLVTLSLDVITDFHLGCSVKPYLRPLSSMTEEEKEELKTLFDAEEVTSDSICYLEGGTLVEYLSRISYSFCSEIVDWLNAHHFDHHNLIEKGLALEASSEMYKKGE